MDARFWVALSAIALAAFFWLRLVLRDALARARVRRRLARAAKGERDAEPLLERAGFRVRGRQVRSHVGYRVDGELHEAEVRADYVVTRGGKAFVAEVKTGSARSLAAPTTRRQLLEYAHAFAAHGVLLVDPERGRIHEISLPPSPTSTRGLAGFFVGFSAGAALVLILFA
jgi:hypothetical protein